MRKKNIQKSNQKSKKRKLLVATLALAALIVGGSTFAWFTSKDEVTNRLTASANYGVALAEDFTPPENWIPGQEINKDVGAVNTGNVDALVRVHLEGAMNVLKERAVVDEVATSGTFPTLTDVSDANLKSLGLTKKDGSGNFYRTLSTTERTNPELSSTVNNNTNNDDYDYSEVEAVQAGGYLAYASGGFKFTPENAGYTYVGNDGTTVNTQTTPSELASTAINNTWNGGAGLEIDSDTFVPTSTGLFIFRRNITIDTLTGNEGNQEYEFSGYYAVVDGNNVTYYALHYLPNESGTYNSDYVIFSTAQTAETSGNVLAITYETENDKKTPIKTVTPTTVKLYSAAYTKKTGLIGTYDGVNSTVTFDNGETGNDKIEVIATVTNIGTNVQNWTALTESASHTYFYYNDDVEEGDTTAKLVDKVKLADDTKNSAYLAFDFDLSVLLESVQVTIAENGKEDIDVAKSEWAEINKAGTKRDTGTTSDIALITWTNT